LIFAGVSAFTGAVKSEGSELNWFSLALR